MQKQVGFWQQQLQLPGTPTKIVQDMLFGCLENKGLRFNFRMRSGAKSITKVGLEQKHRI